MAENGSLSSSYGTGMTHRIGGSHREFLAQLWPSYYNANAYAQNGGSNETSM